MTETAETPADKPELWTAPPPLSGPQLFNAGFRAARPQLTTLGALALAYLAATVALRLGARGLGATTSGLELTPGYFAYEALVAVVNAVVSGLALRALLAEGRERFRLDRAFAGYTALAAAAAMIAVLVTSLVTASDPSEGAMVALLVIALGVVLVGLIYVFTKLLLWPVGVLMGDAELTPRRSWALMHRASWGYILTLVLGFGLLFPVYLVIMIPSGGDADNAPVPFVLLEHAATAVWVVYCACVAAAVFRARVRGEAI